jgi:hypothetical protein
MKWLDLAWASFASCSVVVLALVVIVGTYAARMETPVTRRAFSRVGSNHGRSGIARRARGFPSSRERV